MNTDPTDEPMKVVSIWTLTPMDKPLDYLAPIHTAIGDVVNVPFGKREILGVVWADVKPNDISKLKTIISKSELPPLQENYRRFVEKMAEYTLSPLGQILRMGLRVPDATTQKKNFLKPINAQVDLTPKQSQLRIWLLENAKQGIDPKTITDFSRAIMNGLVERGGALWIDPIEIIHKPQLDRKKMALNAEQKNAVDAISASDKPVLLKGVTGSGKTEVYFEAVANALRSGRQALIMLPEIALTDRFIARCAARFGIEPGHWHSDMGVTARRDVWNGVAGGKVPIVIGARSALFLPFKNLGLIVVDEEHDSAFKQEEGVIYHGRDMAVLRGHFENAHVLLASATPSIESLQNAQIGRYERVELNERFGEAVLPKIRVSDMRDAGLNASSWIGPELVLEMKKRLELGEQSLLFLNRRGFAPLTICRACGHQLGCPNCDARLVEHRARGRLQCHQCGYETRLPKACTECEVEDKLAPIGPGVERLAEEVREHFPDGRILVLSSDLVQGEKRLKQEINAIMNGEYDIIVGTQMVAKGHNFSKLTLVGIIDADIGLEGGDLRAAERSFQLLRQVTGRAGRAEKPGLALVQTYQPDHALLNAILRQDDEAFFALELRGREQAMAPPFSRFVAVIISSPDLNEAVQIGRDMASGSQALQSAGMRIFGPAIAPISRIRGRSRVRLLVKMPKNLALHQLLQDWRNATKKSSKVKITLDVDPQSFF